MPETARADVELRLRADLANLPIVRGVCTTVAMGTDFTMDEIADLRLAVDEVCSQLITLAAPGAVLDCRFHLDGDAVRFTAGARSRDGRAPATDSFGWHVLRTLADEVGAEVGGGDEPVVRISIRKRRAA